MVGQLGNVLLWAGPRSDRHQKITESVTFNLVHQINLEQFVTDAILFIQCRRVDQTQSIKFLPRSPEATINGLR